MLSQKYRNKLKRCYCKRGLCEDCGKRRHPDSKTYCVGCLEKRRLRQRARTGCQPHVSHGRPPLT